ncbi:BlaI/MecI/CopY family transcriptional regulator [Gimesia sp.]|uniref:BlaI/MecI/CopY family transcriptional regulator n=1 Tax=Gimesia sp. TaxID=2024833 RepID=UPI003A9564CB
MARPGSEHPTELELEILKILWDEAPLPVRDVRARLEAQAARPLAHSSVITTLNIMFHKGFVKRKKDGKSFLFSPRLQKKTVTGGIIGDLLSRVFDGSSSALVMNLIETADLDSDELTALRKLIAQKAKEQQQ